MDVGFLITNRDNVDDIILEEQKPSDVIWPVEARWM